MQLYTIYSLCFPCFTKTNVSEAVEHPFVLLLGDLVGHTATSKAATVSTMDVLFNMIDARYAYTWIVF